MTWLILRTRPRFELKLETAVQQLGIHAYAPKTITRRRHPFDKRQTIVVKRALYPGYLFAPEHFPVEAVTTTTLSAHWLMDGDRLAQVSDRIVSLAEEGEAFGRAVEAVLEALRCAPLTKQIVKRAPYTKDLKSLLGRAA